MSMSLAEAVKHSVQYELWIGPAELRENYGFPKRMLSHIRGILTEHSEELCGMWEEIHGIA
jgi:hypothetical protein